MPRPICIFCDRPAKSGEHLWSKWMRPLIGNSFFTHRMESGVDYSRKAVPFGEIAHRQSQGPPEQMKIKVVCSTCNNGWMNNLEKARTYLAPLIKGETAALDALACKTIAQWIFLKALILSHAPNPSAKHTPHFIYSRQQRLGFKVSGDIPPDFEIWIARGSLVRWRVGVRLGSANLLSSIVQSQRPANRPVRNLQTVIWGLGELVIQTFARTDSQLGITWHPIKQGVKLWPAPWAEIIWPPEDFLTDEDMDSAASGFSEAMLRIPRSPQQPPNAE